MDEYYSQAEIDYTQMANSIETYYEEESEMLEKESKDFEENMDQEKTLYETLMEEYAQESDTVKQYLSQAIQNEVVKLS